MMTGWNGWGIISLHFWEDKNGYQIASFAMACFVLLPLLPLLLLLGFVHRDGYILRIYFFLMVLRVLRCETEKHQRIQ